MNATLKIVTVAGLAVTSAAPAVHARHDAIGAIRSRYNIVNHNLHRYSAIERPLLDYSTEGADVKGHFAGRSPRKVTAHVYGCTSQTLEEHYFWNNRLIFSLVTRMYYQSLGSKVEKTSQQRFYFADGRLIRWIDEQSKYRNVSSTHARQEAGYVLKGAREFLTLAQEARKDPKLRIEFEVPL